jgi:glycosyltransferase involved in cell wall biosynthesis
MIKILIASFTFPPNKDGVSEAASVMAEGFQEEGWAVEIVTEPTHPPRESLNWKGIPIHEFSISGSPYPQNPYKGQIHDYQNFLISGNWDVIIFHAYFWPVYLCVPLLSKIRARKVLVSHGYSVLSWIPSFKFPFGLASLVSAFILSLIMLTWIKKFDRWVFLDKKTDLKGFYDQLLAKLVKHSGIRIIPNGVEQLKQIGPKGNFREEITGNHKENSIVFICVANYSRRKDQGFAVRSFRRAAIPNSYLVFIGSEFNEWSRKFQNEDLRFAKSDHNGRILWMEKNDRSHTLDAISNSDVMILSSDAEAQPIALLESMREMIPWIARDSGCISRMPGGITITTEKEMAAAMIKMANDSLLRKKLGLAGFNAVNENYNKKNNKHLFCNLIRDLTN